MAISHRLTLLSLGLLISLQAGGADSAWIDDRLKKPSVIEPSALDQMTAFIIGQIPPLAVPGNAADWTDEAESLRERVLEEVVFKGVPENWREGNHQVVWGEIIETGKGYRIKKVTYDCLPGLHISALLYEPVELKGKVPAILNVNGHVGAPGKAIEYEQIRCINLAKRGILALHPEWLSFGDLTDSELSHNSLAYLDLCGVSGLSVFYLAMRGGLDVLLDHPNADLDRVAMTGLSGGGWQTIILSSLDPRIKICVPNAGYSSLVDRAKNRGDIGDLEQNPADLLTLVDYTHLTAMLAPRPALLIYNAEDECCFKAERAVPSVYDPIVPFYDLFGKKDVFRVHINEDPGTHNYDLDNRRRFYQFVYDFFLPEQTANLEELHSAEEILSVTELAVPLPEDNATFATLAQQQFDRLPSRTFEKFSGDSLENAKRETRVNLRKVLRIEETGSRLDYILKESASGLNHSIVRLGLGEDWKLPVHVFSEGKRDQTLVLIADKGVASASDLIRNRVEEGFEVWAFDPLLLGENKPADTPTWQFAQMFSTVGTPPLGIQVAQVLALVRGIERTVLLEATGPTAEVIALCAGALDENRISEVRVGEGYDSFKDLIAETVSYSNHPTLFCFGLLAVTDIPQLRQLCRAVNAE